MNLSMVCSLKVAFALRAGKGLSHFQRLLNSGLSRYTLKSLRQHRRPEIAPAFGGGLGIPENAQAALPKSSIRSQTSSDSFVLRIRGAVLIFI